MSLPPLVVDTNPSLFRDLTRFIATYDDQITCEMRTFLANLSRFFRSDLSVRAMMLLDPEHLLGVARIVEGGLSAARTKPGRKTRSSASGEVDINSAMQAFSAGVTRAAMSTLIPTGGPPIIPDGTATATAPSMPSNTSPSTQAPLTSIAVTTQRQAMWSKGLSSRDKICCIIGLDGSLDAAHIIPHSVVLAEEHTEFWSMLTILWGEDCMRRIRKECLDSAGKERLQNGLMVDSSFHCAWDASKWRMEYVNHTPTTIDVMLYKRCGEHFVSRLPSCPPTPAPSPVEVSNSLRFLSHGDIFRLATSDPVRFPLPTRLLIEARAELQIIWCDLGFHMHRKSTEAKVTAGKRGAKETAARPKRVKTERNDKSEADGLDGGEESVSELAGETDNEGTGYRSVYQVLRDESEDLVGEWEEAEGEGQGDDESEAEGEGQEDNECEAAGEVEDVSCATRLSAPPSPRRPRSRYPTTSS